MNDERADEDAAAGDEADDTEGQTLTWKVREPEPEASAEDAEDDTEGHARGPTRPPVD